jgi:hypothetical protein
LHFLELGQLHNVTGGGPLPLGGVVCGIVVVRPFSVDVVELPPLVLVVRLTVGIIAPNISPTERYDTVCYADSEVSVWELVTTRVCMMALGT